MNSLEQQITPLLAKYCVDCHGGAKPKAGLNLAKVADEGSILKDRKLWGRLVDYVEAGEMPPEGREQPTADEVELLSKAIGTVLDQVDCSIDSDPGRVTIRRLNRAEYNNTIRDLVGIDFHPADDFPSDDVGYGFDNIGDVLTLPPLLFEKYLDAAEAIAERAIVVDGGTNPDDLPESHRRIIFRTPTAENRMECARAIVERFASRAYRRPASAGEVGRILRFVDLAEQSGDSFERGIQLAVEAILCSPQFLFRVEIDPRPRRRGEQVPPVHPINEYELASRLSYFLWTACPTRNSPGWPPRGSSGRATPSKGRSTGCSATPRSRALVENFADQWLQLRCSGRSTRTRSGSPRSTTTSAGDDRGNAPVLRVDRP